MSDELEAVRVVPGDRSSAGPCLTQGTRVLMPDGTEIPNVYKIVLSADVNQLWRAEIHCYARMEEITAGAKIYRVIPPDMEEVTRLDDPEPRYARDGHFPPTPVAARPKPAKPFRWWHMFFSTLAPK